MRTTLNLESDAMDAVHAYARKTGLPMGKAASQLIRRGYQYQLTTRTVNGLPVFEVPEEYPRISTRQVLELLNEE